MLELGIKMLASYLLGSLNGSLILGRFTGVDIRRLGSGNAGVTNALRTVGPKFAVMALIIDVAKGFLPPWLLPLTALPGLPLDPEISRAWLSIACAGAAIVGHCYPVWFDFAGGKGAATTVGAVAAIAPQVLVPGALVWIVVLVTTGYVGLATVLAASAMLLWVAMTGIDGRMPLFAFLVLLACFVLFTHRSNLRRLWAGTENRMEKVRLFRRGRVSD